MSEKVNEYLQRPNACINCKLPILPHEGQRLSDVRIKKFCNQSCAAIFNNKGVRRHPKKEKPVKPITLCFTCGKRPAKVKYCSHECALGLEGNNPKMMITKGELFQTSKSWQGARSAIQRHAHDTYMLRNPNPACIFCGYATHVEVAHRRAVADFPDTATLTEINASTNLIALCPNHHWELDTGMITLAEIENGVCCNG